MLDDTDSGAPALDPLDAGRVYRNYFGTCRRLGVEAVPRGRAEDLFVERSDAIAAGRSVPPIACRPSGPKACVNKKAKMH